jgi:hypothetical protein
LAVDTRQQQLVVAGVAVADRGAAMTCKTRNSLDLIRFPDEIDETIPPAAGRQIIAIMDNLSTHKSKETKVWLKAHPALAVRVHAQPRVMAQPGGAVEQHAPASGCADL